MSMGEILKQLRGNRTQEEMAAEIGVTKSSYSMYERNERTPRDEVKVRIARVLGISVEKLFFEQFEH